MSPSPASEIPFVSLSGLTVRYGDRTALDGVSLAVAAGKVYALLGRNGAGKSSLVRCLLGEQKPAAGQARLFGRDVWRERARVLADVGVVPEEPNAPPGATARQIARFCSRLYPRWDGGSVVDRLARFDVPPDLPFGKLSKGQKGQVALALALASSPRLLVLDDPTLGLDAVARRAVFAELIGDLADRGTTVFLTTHDLLAVEGIADRVGILSAGRLLLDEEVETLKRRFRRIEVLGAQGAPGAAPALERLAPLAVVAHGWGTETVVSAYDDGSPELAHAVGSPGGGRVTVSAMTLEDIFIALVGGAPKEKS